jgi:Phosphatidylinositol 3- and 4-kinase
MPCIAGVPPTALVSVHVSGVGQGGPAKVGSLQQFVDAECDAEERGCSSWPVQEVHKIAVLDMRLANTDRNGSNILARRDPDGGWQLVPIDHGYALPASLEDLSFEWAWWPQADVPFDERTRSYIARLDADADLQLLGAHGIALREECATVFRIATLVLQKGAAAGLTAGQIAGLLSRQGAARSTVERLWAAAQRLARARGAAALGELSLLLDQYIAEEHALEGDMTL